MFIMFFLFYFVLDSFSYYGKENTGYFEGRFHRIYTALEFLNNFYISMPIMILRTENYPQLKTFFICIYIFLIDKITFIKLQDNSCIKSRSRKSCSNFYIDKCLIKSRLTAKKKMEWEL